MDQFDIKPQLDVKEKPPDEPVIGYKDGPQGYKFDCIYDDEPLGFKKNPEASATKMQPEDPLEEVDLGDRISREQLTSVLLSTQA